MGRKKRVALVQYSDRLIVKNAIFWTALSMSNLLSVGIKEVILRAFILIVALLEVFSLYCWCGNSNLICISKKTAAITEALHSLFVLTTHFPDQNLLISCSPLSILIFS
jgi:hypothetical protein